MSFLKKIKIYDTEHTKLRLGSESDGGYVVLDEVSQNSKNLISYGVESNTSFEEKFVDKYGATAWLFDHTVESPVLKRERMFFKKEGVSTKKTKNLNTLSSHVQEIRESSDFSNQGFTLKMDIEWNEWDVFDSASESLIDKFDQIICEFHIIPVQYSDLHSPYFRKFHRYIYKKINSDLYKKYKLVLDKLQKSHYIYHVHANNSLSCNNINREKIPNLVELCFVNKKLVNSVNLSKDKFPIKGLDFPNKIDRPDILDIDWNKNG
jgi:hypothetical protein